MARKPEVHTVHNPNGSGWINRLGGKPVSQHRTKEVAVERGRTIAIQHHTEHAIHNLDGTIGRKNSYGGDPNPPKDNNR